MLLSGTLADLDLPSIAAMTSLGRTSLRLELRESSGDLIGSMVLKAGRVVSATAGDVRGRDALRVIMNSSSDTRFQLAQEPLDFVMSSALASVDELWQLARGTTGATPLPRLQTADDPDQEGTLSLRPGSRPLTAPSPVVIPPGPDRLVMEGSLTDFDLPTLLHTIGCSRQYCALEVGDEQAIRGTICIKSGIMVSATAGSLTGIPAVQHLIASSRDDRFRLIRLTGDLPDQVPIGPVGHVLLHADAPAPVPRLPTNRLPTSGGAPAPAPDERTGAAPAEGLPVMEGTLSDFDVRTVVEVLAATRQHARLQILAPGQPPLGEVTLKAGWILSCQAGELRGREALSFLLAASPRLQFRVLTMTEAVGASAPVGAVHEVLGGLPGPRAARPEVSTRILRWAIPISFALGGMIVFLVTRGGTTTRAVEPHEPPAAQHQLPPAEPTAPKPTEPAAAATAPRPAPPPAATAPSAATAPPGEAPSPPTASAPPSPSAASAPPSEPPASRTEDPAPAAPDDDTAPSALVSKQVGVSIRNAQTALKQLGYDPGALDGVHGHLTRNAILRFQRSQHLRATGVLDQETWSAIVAQLMAHRPKP